MPQHFDTFHVSFSKYHELLSNTTWYSIWCHDFNPNPIYYRFIPATKLMKFWERLKKSCINPRALLENFQKLWYWILRHFGIDIHKFIFKNINATRVILILMSRYNKNQSHNGQEHQSHWFQCVLQSIPHCKSQSHHVLKLNPIISQNYCYNTPMPMIFSKILLLK